MTVTFWGPYFPFPYTLHYITVHFSLLCDHNLVLQLHPRQLFKTWTVSIVRVMSENINSIQSLVHASEMYHVYQ